ncbi:MAG TPA: hypothetical protein VL943_03585, partial [Niabella sp.]|nr:hypothetical protein [Niabella sp.]
MLQAPILLYSLQQPVLLLNKLAKRCIKLLYLLITVSSAFVSNQAAAQKTSDKTAMEDERRKLQQ